MDQSSHSQSPVQPSRVASLAGLVSLLVLLTACEKQEATAYQIPKEERTSPTAAPGSTQSTDQIPDRSATGPGATGQSSPAGPTAPSAPAAPITGAPQSGMTVLPGMERSAEGAGEVTWGDLPDTWESFNPSGIRVANFRINNDGGRAELTVLAFPGDVGGDLANVNRWRQQIGLSDLRPDALEGATDRIEVDGRDSLFVVLHGPRESVVGAFVPTETHTWFFKMQGSSGAVTLEESAFLDFMQGVKITTR